MTATGTITSQAVTEWVKLFPRTVTETYTSSVTFMKQLTVIAVSTITYLKNVFPEESYTVESFGGIRLRILKKKCKDELAQFVSTALTQAFEAFDKKYLHQLALCFYDGECKLENLIEYHVFEFSYNPDGVTMDVHSKNRDSAKRSTRYSFDNVRDRTIHMIRSCVVIMQTCQNELPSTYDVSLRLYYNDSAPEGYQAPGFLSTSESEDHIESTLAEAVKLGWVETPYHKLVTRTYCKEAMTSSHDAIPSQNPPAMTQDQGDDFNPREGDQRSTPGPEVSAGQLLCSCNRTDVEDQNLLLTCIHCGRLQHASCYGVRRQHVANIRHTCVECGAQHADSVTDPRLDDLTPHKRECLCIFRRTLDWCAQESSVSATQLVDKFDMSHVNATKLMKLLHSHGIIEEDSGSDQTSSRQIIHNQLERVMVKFFQNEEQNIVDRLLAETLSQTSKSDPVGDVLSPMEKVSLQTASTLGRVVQPEVIKVPEDSMLKEYREAILTNQVVDEEMPLSGNHNPVKDMEKIGKPGKRKLSDGTKRGVRTKRAKTTKKI
ncbi:uncharacterized protein LOC115452538 [Manduca sexta]|uniref:uncharacterized protein LOC115452538 n=1 Tax=Manduca sexta TaxID=7130 RepID=UPI00189014E6|nr:uncharacterized protein LOC115452538 [Manduca sexta]